MNENLLKKFNKIMGWLSQNEGTFLYKLANQIDEGYIVEIGSWNGKSSFCLANGLNNKTKLICIDKFCNTAFHNAIKTNVNALPKFHKNIINNNLQDKVILLAADSIEASKLINVPVKLLFIDGSHDYESIKSDFNNWNNKLVKYGLLVVHDYDKYWADVPRFIDTETKGFAKICLIDTLIVLMKII